PFAASRMTSVTAAASPLVSPTRPRTRVSRLVVDMEDLLDREVEVVGDREREGERRVVLPVLDRVGGLTGDAEGGVERGLGEACGLAERADVVAHQGLRGAVLVT